ncbi:MULTISPECIES: protein kinase [Clostridium]|uniref:protein kinase n=2 Tax=Clostridiaceae TaxID=31979 RepID=UPI001EED8FAA|nr:MULTISPECIES: protein kinase [Clostridium]WRY51748.1 protein kinase [Clostridium intestinale]
MYLGISMDKKYDVSLDFDEEVEKLFRQGEYLDRGHNGVVYLLPGKKIIKIFYDKKICLKEAYTLKKAKGSKYFPKMTKYGDYYIIREMVDGIRLDKYIKKVGLTKDISRQLYDLIKEFKRLKFTKLDIRCRDIYVDDKGNIRVIDPKDNYVRRREYPRHLMKGLEGVDALESFLENIKEFDRNVAKMWKSKIDKYFKLNIK